MKSLELIKTKHPDLFRVVNRDGDWRHYFHKPSKTYLRGITTVLGEGYPKGEGFVEYLVNATREERDAAFSIAGDRGDMVHRFIEEALTAAPKKTKHVGVYDRNILLYNRLTKKRRLLTNSEWDCVVAFERFWKAHEPIILACESSVFNLAVRYAGTLDAILVLTKECEAKTCKCAELIGKPGLWDWKSSGKIYSSYSAQTAALAEAENIYEFLPKGQQIEYTAILRIGTSHKETGGYEMRARVGRDTIATDFERFLAAKLLSDFEYPPFDYAKAVEEIPDEVRIAVVRPSKPKKKAARNTKPKK